MTDMRTFVHVVTCIHLLYTTRLCHVRLGLNLHVGRTETSRAGLIQPMPFYAARIRPFHWGRLRSIDDSSSALSRTTQVRVFAA